MVVIACFLIQAGVTCSSVVTISARPWSLDMV